MKSETGVHKQGQSLAYAKSPQATVSTPLPSVKRRGFRWPLLIYLLIALGIGYWAFRSTSRIPEVDVATARNQNLTASFTAEGYVRGKDYVLAPEVAGRVSAVYVRENQTVAAGDLLMRMDDSDVRAQLRQAEAAQDTAASMESRARAELRLASEQTKARISAAESNLRIAEARFDEVKSGARSQEIQQAVHRAERAQAVVDNTLRTYERARFLFNEGALPKASLDDAEAKYLTAKAERDEAQEALSLLRSGARAEQVRSAQAAVDAAKADLRVAKSGEVEIDARRIAMVAAHSEWSGAVAAVERIRTNMPRAELRAPTAGIVSRVLPEVGTIAAPGSPAITLSTRQDLHIEAEISSEDAGKVARGMPVSVTSPAYPGQVFKATVETLSPVGELKPDAAIRTRIVRARVMLSANWQLFRPGMEVDVEGARTLKRALAVPNDAISIDGPRTFVFVLADGVVQERDVKTGHSNVDYTEILGGIREGETVVVRGKEGLESGTRVKVKQ